MLQVINQLEGEGHFENIQLPVTVRLEQVLETVIIPTAECRMVAPTDNT